MPIEEAEALFARIADDDVTAVSALIGVMVQVGSPYADEAAGLLEGLLERHPRLIQSVSLKRQIDRQRGLACLKEHPDRWGLAVVLSRSSDGYIREAAVKALRQRSPGIVLPILIERVDDWVGVVAREAEAACYEKFPTASDDELLQSLPVVRKLAGKQRRPGEGVVETFEAELSRRPVLLKKVRTRPDGATIRWLFKRSIANPVGPTEELIWEALGSWDAVVRLQAAELVGTKVPASERSRFWHRMLRDRLPSVRLQAMQGLAESSGLVEAVLVELLFDRNARVRNDARFYLKGTVVFRDLYRDRLPDPSAVAGLGETGHRQDADLIEPLLSHPQSTVRRAAAYALGHLGAGSSGPVLQNALADSSPSVAREALRALRRTGGSVDPDHLQRILFSPESAPGVRRNTMQALDLTSRWEQLATLLISRKPLRDQMGPLIDVYLARWLARGKSSPASPRREQWERCQQALKDVAAELPEPLRAALAEDLRRWENSTR
jgi:HEAT repeat protein